MARNISFALTTEQFRKRTKTVTRRKGWKFLKSGDILTGCVKCMGLKPGEKIERLGQIRVVDVRQEPLSAMTRDDVWAEGFNGKTSTPDDFISMFCEHMGGDRNQIVTRIEFEYLDGAET